MSSVTRRPRTHSWPGEASTDDPVHVALKAAIEVETRGWLWGEDSMFVPYVSDTIFGDGRALLLLQPLNTRPCYYIVRIDSSWVVSGDRWHPDKAPELWDYIDEIETELEYEFGNACQRDEEDEEDDTYPLDWPAFNGDSGCSWARTDWPTDRGFALDPHPYSSRYNILSDVRDSALVQQAPLEIEYRVSAATIRATAAFRKESRA